jgi:hypothetical protein
MTRLQKIDRFLNVLTEKELKQYLRQLLNETLTIDDLMESVDYG